MAIHPATQIAETAGGTPTEPLTPFRFLRSLGLSFGGIPAAAQIRPKAERSLMRGFHQPAYSMISLAVALAAVVPSGVLGGTIRHDRGDHLYRSAAGSPHLAAVVQLLVNDNPSCSGTLIAPQWVLTAAHCIWPDPSMFPLLEQTIVVGGQKFRVGPDDIYINTAWVTGGFDVLSTRGDIALIRLPAPVSRVKPIPVNRGKNEVGQIAFTAGFGSTGTGLTGNNVRTAQKRVGMNVIDATQAQIVFPAGYPFRRPLSVGASAALLTDFDNSTRTASTLGDAVPLNLEYTTARGDSGGPLLLAQGRNYSVAGVTSGGIDGFTSTSDFASFYSDVATFTRVVSYLAWIDSVIAGRQTNMRRYIEQLLAAGGQEARTAAKMLADRKAALRQQGWRLQMRTPLADFSPRPLEGHRWSLGGPPVHGLESLRQDVMQGFSGRSTGPEPAEPAAGSDAVLFESCPCCSGP